MIRILCIATVVGLAVSAASAQYYPPGVTPGDAWVELNGSVSFISTGPEAGNWEYIYDVWGGNNTFLKDIDLYYDFTKQVNVWQDATWGQVTQMWGAMSAGQGIPNNGWTMDGRWASEWEFDPDTFQYDWALGANDWALDNPWHTGGEYNSPYHVWVGPETSSDENHVRFHNHCSTLWWGGWAVEGLSLTVRVVHPYGPGIMDYAIGQGGISGTVIGPVIEPGGLPGDFDGDGDVDTDDIDLLCDNLGDAAYDLDGDGDADEDDFVYLIETLVELTDGSGRTGTQVGDFNLDGLINATDLAIMNPNFGLGGMLYANGNANCDDLINATDLAILAANFGYVAPAGAVPEPITMCLLSIGGLALLRRRR
ncbi:MAG: PEP-CTERM sorting domain-containing protein [Planctomycetota bacterium]|jgi:hypothetical protein